jgi:glycerol-3-phosphate O-acyltransferase
LGKKLAILARFASRQSILAVLGRRYRHGYACVNFGTPVSMRAHVAAQGVDFRSLDDAGRREPVAALGKMLMARIGKVVPVLPVPLVASVLLRDEARALSELELKAAVHALMDRIEAGGGHVYVPRTDRDYALTVGLRMLTLRGLVDEHDGLFQAHPAEVTLLRYYANSIAHLVA